MIASLTSVFLPALPHPHPREALRASSGALLGLLVTQIVLWMAARALGLTDAGLLAHPMLIAPFGASAVLVYAVPSSPLAQPWSVVVGNTVAAVIAVALLHLGLAPVVTICLAALLSIAAMSFARALHPPSGAVAVATVLAATPDHMPGLTYILLTVFCGSALLVAVGIAYNRATARSYPFRPAPAVVTAERRLVPTPLALASALDRMRMDANLGVEDLAELIEAAEEAAVSQSLRLDADRIMTADPITVLPQTDWQSLSALFVEHGYRTLPVVDGYGRFEGLIPVQAMLRPGAGDLNAGNLADPVATLYPDASLADILPPLAQGRQTCLPVVAHDGSLVGLITRSDVMAALIHAQSHAQSHA